METVHRFSAGLDVHKASVMACVRVLDNRGKQFSQVREFGTMTRDLEALSKWLASHGVTHVAMESTGVYWKPIWNVLEDRFEIMLCNAKHVKQVPGRKTDVKDCEWLAKLLQHGLLQGSFIPPARLRELRDLTRYRAKVVSKKTAEINRLQKVLEDANIKLKSVASDVMGASGRAMIQAIMNGVEDPKQLAGLAKQSLRKKIPELKQALRGHVRDHHRYLLRLHYEQILDYEAKIEELSERILTLEPSPEPPPGGAPCPGPLFENPAAEPADPVDSAPPPPLSFREAVVLLDSIPGVNERCAEDILAEIGTDMSRFRTAAHLASWGGVCPGNNESAGKRRNSKTTKGDVWLKRAVGIAASGASKKKDCRLATKYKRIAKRRGSARAIVALSHTILAIAHYVLTHRQPYHELGADYYDRQNAQKQVRYHMRRLAELGVTQEPAQGEAA